MRDVDQTRAKLVAAARRAFAENGYDATTVRRIALDAGVNPALINRYFGGKEGLFATSVPVDLELPSLGDTPRGEVGPRLVAHFFQRWEGRPEDDLLQTLIRTAPGNSEAAARMRGVLADQVGAMVASVQADRPRERAALIATQILGLAYVRYVLGVADPVLPADLVIPAVGWTIERYLFDELPEV